jgi:hypothetical protein
MGKNEWKKMRAKRQKYQSGEKWDKGMIDFFVRLLFDIRSNLGNWIIRVNGSSVIASSVQTPISPCLRPTTVSWSITFCFFAFVWFPLLLILRNKKSVLPILCNRVYTHFLFALCVHLTSDDKWYRIFSLFPHLHTKVQPTIEGDARRKNL